MLQIINPPRRRYEAAKLRPDPRVSARPLRILYVINSLEGGGAAFPVPAIVQTLERYGASVSVCALTPRDLRAGPAFERAHIPVDVRAGSHRDHLQALKWLRAKAAIIKPDIIWTSLTRATLLGQIVGQWSHIPVVSWQHAAYLKPANAALLKLREQRSLLWIADSAMVAQLTHRRLGIPCERIVTWPIFKADPSAPLRELWSPGQTLRLGSLGRLHHVKGYDVLVEALAILRQEGFEAPVKWRIAVAGAGKQADQLKRYVASTGVENIHFTGFEEEPARFLADQHAYLQPSRSEGFCVAAHEAMQAGLPILASAVGELTHSVSPETTGWLVPPGDPRKLAVGLVTLLGQPERLAAMGDRGRTAIMAKFSAETFDEVGRSILERLAASVPLR